MLTQFPVIGDFHAAPGPRNADRYASLDQIIREGLALPKLGAWLWPGDIFDAESTTNDRNALDVRFQMMANAAPVVVCYGNHDRPGDLDGFMRLDARFPIHVVSAARVEPIALATGQIAKAFVLPYPDKARLVSAGIQSSDLVPTAGDLLEPIFMDAAQRLQEARAQGNVTLMLGHINVAGAIASTGQPNIGREIELNPRHLDRLGNMPKLLNHIHRPQELHGAYYTGSVARQDYGEIEPKRYLVVTFDDVDVWTIESRPLQVPPMFHVGGAFTPDGFVMDPIDGVDYNAQGIDWTGADVRVRYRYKASQKPALNEDKLRALFAGALRLKIESVVENDRELRAPAVAAAVTLHEKLAAFRHESALPVSLQYKLERLDADDVDALLADVAHHLKQLESLQAEAVPV